MITYIEYDFKGNLLEKKREVISDTDILNVFSGPPINWDVKAFVVDWNDAPTLEGSYLSTMSYDAINRVTRMIYPEDIDSERKELIPTYSKSGALEKVKVDGNNYVDHIAYNAQGQRLLVAYANGVMSRYAYYNKRTWLVRMRSEAYSQNGWEFTGTGSAIQDNHHSFDLVGNIVEINEKTPNCGIGGTNSLKREFKYDPLYRLVFGDGRENSPTISPIWDDSYRSTDNLTTTYYKQLYDYDKLGNILKLQHIGNNDFTRNFTYNSINNKLQSIDIGMTSYSFSYDASGNQTGQTSNRNLVWDYRNLLRAFYVQAGTSEPSQYAQYLYGADGVRVKKLVRVQGGNYTSNVYIDDVFEYKTDGTDEQNLLHIMDNQSRIAMIRLGNDFGDTTPAIKYNLDNHILSSKVLLNNSGGLVNKEEYYPFGETSFGSYAKKRFKFTGKECDEESGLYYYGARYYSAWTCRFISVDPKSSATPNLTSYHYASNNPINRIDPDGMQDEPSGESVGTEINLNGTNTSDDIKTDDVENLGYNNENLENIDIEEISDKSEKDIVSTKDIQSDEDWSKFDTENSMLEINTFTFEDSKETEEIVNSTALEPNSNNSKQNNLNPREFLEHHNLQGSYDGINFTNVPFKFYPNNPDLTYRVPDWSGVLVVKYKEVLNFANAISSTLANEHIAIYRYQMYPSADSTRYNNPANWTYFISTNSNALPPRYDSFQHIPNPWWR